MPRPTVGDGAWDPSAVPREECDRSHSGGSGCRGPGHHVGPYQAHGRPGAHYCERRHGHQGDHWFGSERYRVSWPYTSTPWEERIPVKIKDFTRTMMQIGDTVDLAIRIGGEEVFLHRCEIQAIEPKSFVFYARDNALTLRCRTSDLIELTPVVTMNWPTGTNLPLR